MNKKVYIFLITESVFYEQSFLMIENFVKEISNISSSMYVFVNDKEEYTKLLNNRNIKYCISIDTLANFYSNLVNIYEDIFYIFLLAHGTKDVGVVTAEIDLTPGIFYKNLLQKQDKKQFNIFFSQCYSGLYKNIGIEFKKTLTLNLYGSCESSETAPMIPIKFLKQLDILRERSDFTDNEKAYFLSPENYDQLGNLYFHLLTQKFNYRDDILLFNKLKREYIDDFNNFNSLQTLKLIKSNYTNALEYIRNLGLNNITYENTIWHVELKN